VALKCDGFMFSIDGLIPFPRIRCEKCGLTIRPQPKVMRHRIINRTTGRLVKNEDGDICEYNTAEEAAKAVERLNQIKWVNPDHAHDIFEVVTTFR